MQKPDWIPDFELKSDKNACIEAYRFFFKKSGGWVFFYIDEDFGTLTVHSDHGDWVHTWNPAHTGHPTLKDFIISADEHYLTGKLTMGRTKDKWDPQGTRQNLIDTAKDDEVLRVVLNEAFALSIWEWELGHDLWLYTAPDEINQNFPDLWEYIVREEDSGVTWLRCGLLPFFRKWLKENKKNWVGQTFEF